MTVRLIGNRLHPESRDGHAGKADNHQNEFEETVSVLDRHRDVVLPDQFAPYEMGDAIVDSGHFRVDDVQNGHMDECTCRQGVEAGFDQCGGMMPPAMPTARIDRRATTLTRISQCAMERRLLLTGAKPVQQLSLRLVAARADHGGNDMV